MFDFKGSMNQSRRIYEICIQRINNDEFSFHRPGGELNAGEDEVEGLKRLLTEVTVSAAPHAALPGGWEQHFDLLDCITDLMGLL